MTDIGIVGQGVPSVVGIAGAPFTWTAGPWTGSITETITNSQVGTFLITQIDAIENAPTASDIFEVSFIASPTNRPIWGTGVGTGHVGAFYDHWSGLFRIDHGQQLYVVASAGSSSSWTMTLQGYYIRLPRSPTFSVFP